MPSEFTISSDNGFVLESIDVANSGRMHIEYRRHGRVTGFPPVDVVNWVPALYLVPVREWAKAQRDEARTATQQYRLALSESEDPEVLAAAAAELQKLGARVACLVAAIQAIKAHQDAQVP
jgi:hypothetical protein